MKKLCLILFILIQPLVFAETPKKEFRIRPVSIPDFMTTLVEVDSTDDKTARIELSDGSVWNVDDTSFENWSIDDDIRIIYDLDKSRFLLIDATTKTVIPAKLDTTSTSKYTITAIDDNGYFIAMEDNRQWCIGYLDSYTSYCWRKGDRLLINKSDYSSARDYCLVNLELQEHVKASLIHWK